MARSGPGAVIGLPSREAEPLSGWIIPAATLSSVDFPLPLGPTTTTNWPGRQSRVMSSIAANSELANRLQTLLSWSQPTVVWAAGRLSVADLLLKNIRVSLPLHG